LPDSDEDLFEARIPPLRPVTIDPPLGEDLGEETDVAPVGPTEYAGAASAESLSAPAEAARPAASMEQLEQQIRDLEARLGEVTPRRGGRPGAPPASGAAPSVAGAETEASPWLPGATVPAAPHTGPPVQDRQMPPVAVVHREGAGEARATAR